MQRTDQDAQDVLAIVDNLLETVREIHPQIRTLYAKSDNAWSYHNSLGPEGLF